MGRAPIHEMPSALGGALVAGTLNLRIPKLRQGSYFPPFLEARKTSEKALVAVIQG